MTGVFVRRGNSAIQTDMYKRKNTGKYDRQVKECLRPPGVRREASTDCPPGKSERTRAAVFLSLDFRPPEL